MVESCYELPILGGSMFPCFWSLKRRVLNKIWRRISKRRYRNSQVLGWRDIIFIFCTVCFDARSPGIKRRYWPFSNDPPCIVSFWNSEVTNCENPTRKKHSFPLDSGALFVKTNRTCESRHMCDVAERGGWKVLQLLISGDEPWSRRLQAQSGGVGICRYRCTCTFGAYRYTFTCTRIFFFLPRACT